MKKILVVDDTKNIRTLLKTCLELNGYEVYTTASSEDALTILRGTQIDLAFLDIKMPKVSGTELLRKMRNLGISTPVIIMTAFATIKNAVDCTKLGAVAYIQKPFTANKVKTILDEVWESIQNKESEIEKNLKLAEDLIKINKLEEALILLKKSLALNPSCSTTYNLMGKIYELKKDFQKAETFFSVANEFKDLK
ncbi:response regulator [Hathewaya histolytica]|uniref:Stage 0 sporulation protein A homolog n=1 Tax=Hathewaya histolytica TaxID=1498 RepID=A0A4U9R0H9_HATHI|nr:response regulator [Hathewaya histolytica]VTQ84526.1 response regulator with CheY-like receiver, AAA-type ATPase, and DNA-binding domains [Hathewaya histolytica]